MRAHPRGPGAAILWFIGLSESPGLSLCPSTGLHMCVLGMHYPSNERQWLPGRGLGSGGGIVSAHVIVVVVFLLFGFVYLCSMT